MRGAWAVQEWWRGGHHQSKKLQDKTLMVFERGILSNQLLGDNDGFHGHTFNAGNWTGVCGKSDWGGGCSSSSGHRGSSIRGRLGGRSLGLVFVLELQGSLEYFTCLSQEADAGALALSFSSMQRWVAPYAEARVGRGESLCVSSCQWR